MSKTRSDGLMPTDEQVALVGELLALDEERDVVPTSQCLNITPEFLARFRREVVAYDKAAFEWGIKKHLGQPVEPCAHQVYDCSKIHSETLIPPPTALFWFLGQNDESDESVLERATQTFWWLGSTCPYESHEVRTVWSLDSFLYGVARFGKRRNDKLAAKHLQRICCALGQFLKCEHCWEGIVDLAPRWSHQPSPQG